MGKEAAFLQLNGFLFRSHAKSLVAALAMEGWLEPWEGDRLKDSLSEEAPAIVRAFLATYTRFMETQDVHEFVDRLRTSI